MQKRINFIGFFLGLICLALTSSINAATCPPPAVLHEATTNYLNWNGDRYVPVSFAAEEMFRVGGMHEYYKSCAIVSPYANTCARDQDAPPVFQDQCKYQYIAFWKGDGSQYSFGGIGSGTVVIGVGSKIK
jgi:hypothetical protein